MAAEAGGAGEGSSIVLERKTKTRCSSDDERKRGKEKKNLQREGIELTEIERTNIDARRSRSWWSLVVKA